MFPQEKHEAIARALNEAFGVAVPEDIRSLTVSAHSDPVFRIVVKGAPYILRIIKRTSDPARYLGCMNAAAGAGLAPRVWYSNVEDRVCITGFVEAVPLPVDEARRRMPGVLRSLHALPPFAGAPNHINTSCTVLLHEGPAVEAVLKRAQSANLVPQAEWDEVFSRYRQFAGLYPRLSAELVSCHNDLKPENVLFDGRDILLGDWEAAFLNDRYADLTAAARFVVSNDEEEAAYLHEYFGQPAGEYRRARFFLTRQVSHFFYAIAYLLLASNSGPLGQEGATPEFGAFQRRVWSGEVDLTGAAMRIVNGRVHWAEAVRYGRLPRFEESLKAVAERRP